MGLFPHLTSCFLPRPAPAAAVGLQSKAGGNRELQLLPAKEQKPTLSYACNFGHGSPHSNSVLRLREPLLKSLQGKVVFLLTLLQVGSGEILVHGVWNQDRESCSYRAFSLVSRRASTNPGWLLHSGIAPWISVGGFWFPHPSQTVIRDVYKPLFLLSGW